ncbi:MAG: bifunctional phosphopantothenoylcysteine decarboxylase/phosphopantothenate--cysteine ligase CoaBC [Myxococcales bacterium]|nr:bifunctional phosphopantothenoylcysteine decarboxylase/phosphopantothenate--cysteine ligase CoaBC [Myxococcales bacterium]
MTLQGRRIHVCVTGGVAAYKGAGLVRALLAAGADVQVAMTPNAQQFIGPLTFQALTHKPVLTRTLDPSEEMAIGHIEFAQGCDALVVAPATANLIGKAAHGLGDDVVSTVLLASSVPVVVAPAMNTQMFLHPAVQANLARLREFGWHVVAPDAGELACGAVGPGRLPDPEVIVAAVAAALAPAPQPLAGRKLVISAGPTREHLDPVRFLSNPSSGRTGFALAEAARRAGAQVVLVHGPVALAAPSGVEVRPVVSALDMHAAVVEAARGADAVVMTAAVADWRPAHVSAQKEAKQDGPRTVTFVRNPDILAELGQRRAEVGRGPLLVGFAAQTGDPREAARGKLTRKQVDLVVANDVTAPGAGFAGPDNEVFFVSAAGAEPLPMMPKTALAERIVAWIVDHLEAP